MAIESHKVSPNVLLCAVAQINERRWSRGARSGGLCLGRICHYQHLGFPSFVDRPRLTQGKVVEAQHVP
jgi:hypothetical protein